MTAKISLRVEDGYTSDFGKGIMRIDYNSMDAIHAKTRDIIEIKGKRKTLAVCLAVYPSDDDKGILRTDNIVQNNARVSLGDSVTIQKVRKIITKHVTVLPLEPIPPGMENYLKDALDGVPVINGDEIAVPYFEKFLHFQVIKAIPTGVISNQKTTFHISQDKKSRVRT